MNATETSREKLYRAAVGPRADFYVPLFLRFDQAGASGRSWNWSAFFVSFYWFLYRRMFGQWTLYCLLIPIAVILLLIYSPTGILGILDRFLTERRTKAASALRAVAKSRLEPAQ